MARAWRLSVRPVASSTFSTVVAPLGARRPPARLPQPRAALGHGRDVLLDRHVREQLQILERAADAEPRDLPVRQADDGLAEPEHLAAVRHQLAGHQVEQRGLAGAVGADQRGDDAGAQRERHVVDGLEAAESLRGTGHLQQDLAVSLLMCPPFDCSWKPHRPPGRKIISSTMARP